MKYRHIITAFFFLIPSANLTAQDSVSKDKLESVLKETLKKSRNAVLTATNEWRFDNTKDNYFKNDTIVLNAARSYRMDYCKAVFWSFYENEKFVLEKIPYCNEPPIMLRPQKEDSIKTKIKEIKNKVLLVLYNVNGIFETFEVLRLRKNEPLSNEDDNQFDYTMTLVRIRK
jgi:hypothetical protein